MAIRAGVILGLGLWGLGLLVPFGTAQAAPKISVVHGNIVCRGRLLTQDGKDSEPVLSPDGHTVAFIHQLKPSPEPDFPEEATNALWLGDCATGRIHQLAAPTSGKDLFGSMGGPIFSIDGRLIYVSLVPGGDYLTVHRVDVGTGQHRFLADFELQGVVRNGPYRGDLLATQHSDLVDRDGRHYGGYPYFIFRPDGTSVLRIAGSERWRDGGLKRWLKARHWLVW